MIRRSRWTISIVIEIIIIILLLLRLLQLPVTAVVKLEWFDDNMGMKKAAWAG